MPNLLPKNPAQRKKLLIWGGLAGALLLIVILSRRGDQGVQPAPEDALAPVASPAPSDMGLGDVGGSAVDNGAQLAQFESALLDQLPSAVESGVAAGLANGVAPPSSSPGAVTINIAPGPGKPATSAKPTVHPASGRLFAGRPLKWWQRPANASKMVRGKRRWRWPGSKDYKHTRPFAGRA